MTTISPTTAAAQFHAAVTAARPQLHATSAAASARAADTVFVAARRRFMNSIAEGFATMESRFKPAAAKGLNLRVQFHLTGPGGGSWMVAIKDGRCTVTSGTGNKPDIVLSASASDYLKISNGEMNKISALLRGKLRVKGEMGKVRPFFACFDKR